MLIVDKQCSDVCCDEFPTPQTGRKNKQVKEHSESENFICNQYEETPAVLDTWNINICLQITKLEGVKCKLFAFFHIWWIFAEKIDFLISQGSVETFLRGGG